MFQLKVVFQLKRHRLIADATNYAACCNRIAAGGVFNGCAVRQGEALTDSGSAALTTGKLPFQRRRGRLLSGQNIQQQLCRGAAGAAAAVAQGGDGNRTHLAVKAVVKAYNRHLLRNGAAQLQKTLDEQVGNFVVVADHSGGLAQAVTDKAVQQFTAGGAQQCSPVLAVVPEKAVVRNGGLPVPQGADETVVALGALNIVTFENARYPAVTGVQQVLAQLIAAGEVVVQQAGKALEITVDSVLVTLKCFFVKGI